MLRFFTVCRISDKLSRNKTVLGFPVFMMKRIPPGNIDAAGVVQLCTLSFYAVPGIYVMDAAFWKDHPAIVSDRNYHFPRTLGMLQIPVSSLYYSGPNNI